MRARLLTALAAFAGIALVAAFTLDGNIRIAVWILMAGLAAKTYLSTLQK